MATIYVSYRNNEQPFVEAVMSRLEQDHDVRIDYKIPPGADWRSHQQEELRRCDVFLVFVSGGTRDSEFQHAEIGAARFSSAFLDGKLVLPLLIDDVETPKTLRDLDHLDIRHRDASRAAQEIRDALARRVPEAAVISHLHREGDLASRLVDVLVTNLHIPPGELRRPVPGYQLDLGVMAPMFSEGTRVRGVRHRDAHAEQRRGQCMLFDSVRLGQCRCPFRCSPRCSRTRTFPGRSVARWGTRRLAGHARPPFSTSCTGNSVAAQNGFQGRQKDL